MYCSMREPLSRNIRILLSYDGPGVKEQIKNFLFSPPYSGGRKLKKKVFPPFFAGEKKKP